MTSATRRKLDSNEAGPRTNYELPLEACFPAPGGRWNLTQVHQILLHKETKTERERRDIKLAMKTPLPHLSAADVCRALPMPAAIEAMREAFRQLASGQVTLPTRQRLDSVGEHGVGLVMPCYCSAKKLFSVKFTTVFHENPKRDLPLIHSLIILTDGTTGEHLAVIDGASVTAIRTGAASGVATDLLARPDAVAVAVFGAGVQSRTQLEAVCCVRAIRRASVFDVNSTAADQFAAEMTGQLGLPVERRDTPAKTLTDADTVGTATS